MHPPSNISVMLAMALNVLLVIGNRQASAAEHAIPPAPEARPSESARQDAPAARSASPSSDDTGTSQPVKAAPAPLPLPEMTPDALQQCKDRLTGMGVRFEDVPPIAQKGACGIAHPVSVTGLPGGIALKPKATLRCPTALALAQWVTTHVTPAARLYRPQAKLIALQQASSYVCRPRNNRPGAKPSEHGLGHAIDIASFIFDDGHSLIIAPRNRKADTAEAFQKAVRFGACQSFTTVLGPGSDAYHDDHLHLDIAIRSSGYRLCRFPE